MLKFAPGYFKTQEMRNSAVKKLLFAILHIPNQYKTQQMCDKLILEDPGMLQFIPYH